MLYTNKYSLIPILDSTDPLQMTFYLDRTIIRGGKFPLEWSPRITVQFLGGDLTTTVQISLSTGPIFCIWYSICLLASVLQIVQGQMVGKGLLIYAAAAGIFVCFDLYYRNRLKHFFQQVIKDTQTRIRTT